MHFISTIGGNMEDLDLPPASDDSVVQTFIDTNWREAQRASREGMECLRRIYPELVQHLPETASRHLKEALRNFEGASRELHLAGRHVLGQIEYDAYLEAQTLRQIDA